MSGAPPNRPDRARAAAAFRELLAAFGLESSGDPNLRDTAERCADAWADTLMAGYFVDPDASLGETYPSRADGPVVIVGIPLLSMCPHHLLPMLGHAHVAFVPEGRVPGFGAVPRLIDAYARRLVLQEDLTHDIAVGLARALGVASAACVVEARHSCVAVTAPAQRDAHFRTSASVGPAETGALLLGQIDASLRGAAGLRSGVTSGT